MRSMIWNDPQCQKSQRSSSAGLKLLFKVLCDRFLLKMRKVALRPAHKQPEQQRQQQQRRQL